MDSSNQPPTKPSVENKLFTRIAKSASVVGFFTMLSRVAGLARDMVTFHFFGATAMTDAFFVAFTIPNIMRRFVAEGALTIAFIPVYLEIKQKEGEQKALEFYSSVLGLLIIALVVIVLLGVALAGYLVFAMASGFVDDPKQLDVTVALTRFMFPYVFFISLVALCMGILNSHKHFAVPAASPILLNLSMVGCVFWFFSRLAEPIFALAIGVLIGGVLQLMVQLPALYRYGLLVKPSWNFNTKPIRKLLRIMFPALFGIAVYQLNLVVLRQLGSYLPAGQISYYYNSDRLMQLALGVFSIAIATAALPAMSEQTAVGDRAGLLKTWLFSTKLTNFITIPSAFGLAAIGMPIVSTLYLHGEYNWYDVQMTAYATMAFAPGLISIAMFRTTAQVFYALEDLRTPVIVGACTLVVNLILGLSLLKYEVVGLALSFSLSSWFQVIMLMIWLKVKTGDLNSKPLWISLFKQVILAIIACSCAFLICLNADWSVGSGWYNVGILFAAIVAAVALYFAGAFILRCEEFALIKDLVVAKMRNTFKKKA